MKKLVSFLFVVYICAFALLLTACGEEHIHSYKSEWSNDLTYHWYECEGEECEEISDKAEHTYSNWTPIDDLQHKMTCECGFSITERHKWNEGEITIQPDIDVVGEKTFTCKNCSKTKTEALEYIPLTTVTEQEWASALNFSAKNCTVKEIIDASRGKHTKILTFDGKKISVEEMNAGAQESVKSFYSAEDAGYYLYTYNKEDECWNKKAIDKAVYDSIKLEFDFSLVFTYADATYDSTSKAYVLSDIATDGVTLSDIAIKFTNGKFASLTLTKTENAQSENLLITAEDGNADITLPFVAVDMKEVTADEWERALTFSGAENYEVVSSSGDIIQITKFDGTTLMLYANYGDGVSEQYYKKEGDVYKLYTLNSGALHEEVVSEEVYLNSKNCNLLEIFSFSDFAYDAEAKLYRANEFTVYEVKYTDVTATFKNGHLISIDFSISVDDSEAVYGSVSVTYGTVEKIVLPSDSDNGK